MGNAISFLLKKYKVNNKKIQSSNIILSSAELYQSVVMVKLYTKIQICYYGAVR